MIPKVLVSASRRLYCPSISLNSNVFQESRRPGDIVKFTESACCVSFLVQWHWISVRTKDQVDANADSKYRWPKWYQDRKARVTLRKI